MYVIVFFVTSSRLSPTSATMILFPFRSIIFAAESAAYIDVKSNKATSDFPSRVRSNSYAGSWSSVANLAAWRAKVHKCSTLIFELDSNLAASEESSKKRISNQNVLCTFNISNLFENFFRNETRLFRSHHEIVRLVFVIDDVLQFDAVLRRQGVEEVAFVHVRNAGQLGNGRFGGRVSIHEIRRDCDGQFSAKLLLSKAAFQ